MGTSNEDQGERRRKNLLAWFADYPFFVTVVLVLAVLGHFWLSQTLPSLNVALRLAEADPSNPRETLSSLALGVAGVSAMVGGFAGVVVVFGLGTENDRFRLLRMHGGRRLRASWISVVLSSFAGAFLAVVAAVLVVAFGGEPGMWVMELCILLAAHGAIRLTVLLAGLAKIVDQEDIDATREKRVIPNSRVIPNKN